MKEHATVELSFHIREQGMDKLREKVEAISDPSSPQYAKYMSTKEINHLTKPHHKDLSVVKDFLKLHNIDFVVEKHRIVRASLPVRKAEKVFKTEFSYFENPQTKQKSKLRSSEYTLPDAFGDSVQAVFGFHGLPLPPRKHITYSEAPSQPADVTPAVIYSTYSVPSRIHIQGSDDHRQAVAEFQGQYEKDSDLAAFFKQFVPNAVAGDEKVAKFVGSPDKQQAGVEASLDIQYIMGVAPHVKTEFWLYANMDFCADLVNWTQAILSDDAAPLVHSVSYGWQGNLSQVQCTNDKVNAVDANFAKLAAKGITIIFASGDSGSGYAPHSTCTPSSGTKGEELTGTVEETIEAYESFQCCQVGSSGKGWTFTPPSGNAPSGATCQPGDVGKADQAYTGTPLRVFITPEPQFCCEISRSFGKYFSYIPDAKTGRGNCTVYNEISGHQRVKGAYSGSAAKPQSGKCTIFSSVTGKKSNENATSGTPSSPAKVQLYPSWPASSPYVTSVGATRFVGQKAGNEEMASDQFGSGGGFSDMFKQTPNAKWQIEAVQQYVNNPPNDPHYPPKGSFDPNGRATPDVSALGEGYQVYTEGRVQPVGGTSASAPAFAGIVALINDARAQEKKPAMGFLNPFLYGNADCFTDVVKGTNAIGRGTGPIAYGFNATKGWDPATGLGTPIFSKLLKAALKN